jgi:uncharacterized protein (TIRG00374 family)
LKKHLITILKFAISFAILGWLFHQAFNDDTFGQLKTSEKHWWRLGVALVVAFIGVCISFYRWFLLVRALQLPLTLIDAFRLGFIGFLFNFVTLGVIGGDAVKAVFVARKTPSHRTEAVTTVFIDRAFGLYGLFVLTSFAYFFISAPPGTDMKKWAVMDFVCRVSVALTIVGSLGIALIFIVPNINKTGLFRAMHRIPKVGGIFRKGVDAVMTYRLHPGTLFYSLLLSVFIHVLLTISVFLVASGLSSVYPNLAKHFVIVPIANVANALPLPGGLGGMEAAMDFLYVSMGGGQVTKGFGLVVSLCFRLLTLVIAAIGVVLYFAQKKQVSELIHEAEEMELHPDGDDEHADAEEAATTLVKNSLP